MSLEITVFDGANCIGGSKIYLLTDGVGVFFDFGINFKKYGLYFEEFLKPRSARGIYDYLALKVIPPLEEIYRKDLFPADLKIKFDLKLRVDAIFLSHAHLDHSGNIGLLDTCIPVCSSSMTAVIAKAIQDSGGSAGFEGDVAYVSPRGQLEKNPIAIGALKGANCQSRQFYLIDDPQNLISLNNFWQKPFSSKKLDSLPLRKAEGKIHNLKIKAFPVDHSIFGATCFALETSAGWIGYSGDFRLHGARGDLTLRCIEELQKLNLNAFIVEGTNIQGRKKSGEDEVYANCLKEAKKASGKLIIADFGPRNIERLLVFLKIAEESRRKLVITAKDAFLLYAMRLADKEIPDILTDKHLYIFDEIKVSPNLWERNFIRVEYQDKYLQASEIQKNQGDFILAFSFWDLKHLLDIMPEGGIYIYSTSEAFTEEQEVDIQRLKNWLDFFGIKTVGFEISGNEITFLPGFHASGHISGEELVEVIQEIKPKTVIPVHTEHPEVFQEKLGSDFKVILPREAIPILL